MVLDFSVITLVSDILFTMASGKSNYHHNNTVDNIKKDYYISICDASIFNDEKSVARISDLQNDYAYIDVRERENFSLLFLNKKLIKGSAPLLKVQFLASIPPNSLLSFYPLYSLVNFC